LITNRITRAFRFLCEAHAFLQVVTRTNMPPSESAESSSTTDEFSEYSPEQCQPGPKSMNRLLRRFYEPLVLLRVLDPTRGAQKCPPISDPSSDDMSELWHKFLDHLSWVCDYKKGGVTVSAIAAQSTPAGPIFWLAANKNPARKVILHLEWVLVRLESAHDASSQKLEELGREITHQCIEFSRNRVKEYGKRLCNLIRKSYSHMGDPSGMQLIFARNSLLI